MGTKQSVNESGASKSWKLVGVALTALVLGGAAAVATHALAAPKKDGGLRTAASFAKIAKPAERSRAMFTEAGKVIMNARCVNCHPAGDTPSQGDSREPHLPAVVRGKDGYGAVGLRCNTCHQAENYEASRVPGHPLWGVAPIEMAWQGLTLGQICEQIKDPKRNGGKSLTQIHEHMAHDTLVGWAWNPGSTRKPVPGTQAQFGELIAGWIDSGAECPTP
ncbi:MAG TPA: Isoquinoline 1-oxidoreductase subunit [Polyangiales bacterium]|nr:Isoquinoline 1-oxidoreductase subunit [Polyangiales bacterium]